MNNKKNMAYSESEHLDDILYGQWVVDQFYELVPKHYEIIKASTYDDITKHYDIIIKNIKNDISFLIEIKGAKRKFKYIDGMLQPRVDDVWIELIGISGHPGWLYGDAKYIAFYRTDGRFCFVDRLKLIEHVTRMHFLYVRKNGYGMATKENINYYQRYSRSGNLDICVYIPSDIIEDLHENIF